MARLELATDQHHGGILKMRKRILIVEDNAETASIIRTILEHLDYDSVTATNGEDGVAMAASKMPDLIIMDMSLPKMDGLEATALIRKDPNLESTPILACTARTKPGDREQCLRSGCTDYLAKPFTLAQLADLVGKLLKESGATAKTTDSP
jgi:CheY-like chemotaxis protein